MSRMPKKTGNEQKSVKPQVRDLLDKYEWFWWGHTASVFGKSGIADTMAFKTGIFMVVESKYDKSKPNARQVGFLNSVRAEQGFAFVVNENTLDQFEVFLQNFAMAVALVQKGEQPPVEVGGPLLEAIRIMTDYPVSVEEFAAQKQEKRDAKKRSYSDDDDSDVDGPRPFRSRR